MIRKSAGIVLRTQKFQETSLLATIYTHDYGRKNFLIKGVRSARGRQKNSFFQPMSNIELVWYDKESRNLQIVTETSNRIFYHELQTQPIKIALGIVIIEVFYHAIKEEEEKNTELFRFLERTFVELDHHSSRLINVFLFFLIHLSRFLGFHPQNGVKDPSKFIFFDQINGTLRNSPSLDETGKVVYDLLMTDFENCREVRFSNQAKKDTISAMLHYFKTHLEGFKEPESLYVLEEVFKP